MSTSDHAQQPPLTGIPGVLPFAAFESDLLVLHTPDGDYVPIRALCELVGLRPAAWIGVTCLHYRREREQDVLRQVSWRAGQDADLTQDWCLQRPTALQWLCWIDPAYVREPRSTQLGTFRKTMEQIAGDVYERQQEQFAQLKRRMFADLATCANHQQTIRASLEQLRPHVQHSLADRPTEELERELASFDQLMADGEELIEAHADALRAALAQMLAGPFTDAYRVDDEGAVVETHTMPILPVLPDLTQVNACSARYAEFWSSDLVSWLNDHGFAATFRSAQGAS